MRWVWTAGRVEDPPVHEVRGPVDHPCPVVQELPLDEEPAERPQLPHQVRAPGGAGVFEGVQWEPAHEVVVHVPGTPVPEESARRSGSSRRVGRGGGDGVDGGTHVRGSSNYYKNTKG